MIEGRGDQPREGAALSILWDNDGVLVDSERFYYESAIEVMAPYGVEIDEPTYIEHSLVKCASIFDFVRQRGVGEEEIDELRLRRERRLNELMEGADCFVPGPRRSWQRSRSEGWRWAV